MDHFRDHISAAVVDLPVAALRRMLALVRLLDRFSRTQLYCERILAEAPEVARFDPGHDAVMMAYDFHLAAEGPKLIEVNTNAGGSLLALMAQRSSTPTRAADLPQKLRERLLRTFADEFRRFSGGRSDKPERIVILDEDPASQYLYPEMQAFAELFRCWGVAAEVVAPEQLAASSSGVELCGLPVDFIYNRHCDFYLKNEAMAGVRAAYLAGRVCLSPNPRAYALLADKRRMLAWRDPALHELLGLDDRQRGLLNALLPVSELLAEVDLDSAWSRRKRHVFKPVDSFGSKGVLMGDKISRKRFNELPAGTTLLQERVPPSLTSLPDGEQMKVDLRLFAYRDRVFGVTARTYRGPVTNLRTPGGGFARVRLV
jgi:hypothetical protein